MRALEELVQDQSVGIATVSRGRDRYGRLKGHIFVGQGQHSRWLQAELVARGAVGVDVTALSPGCAHLLLALEDNARRTRTGLWAHAAYRVRDAAQPWRLLHYRSTYQIVEGRVHKVARVRKRIFINFDKNWRTDFTVGLTARIVRQLGLTAQQIDALEGRRVQVRGWIERRGGPFIFLRSRTRSTQSTSHDDPTKATKAGTANLPDRWPVGHHASRRRPKRTPVRACRWMATAKKKSARPLRDRAVSICS